MHTEQNSYNPVRRIKYRHNGLSYLPQQQQLNEIHEKGTNE